MYSKSKNIIFGVVSDLQPILISSVFDTNWTTLGAAIVAELWTTGTYIWCLYQLVFHNLAYADLPHQQLDKWAIVHIYHLALTFKLWYHKHYRAESYQQDLKDNLKNVALPGTGIPLSIFCCHYWVALVFVALGVPLYCLLGAFHTVLDGEIRSYLQSETPPGTPTATPIDATASATATSTAAAAASATPSVTTAHSSLKPKSKSKRSAVKALPVSKLEEVCLRILVCYREYLLHPTDWFSLWRLNCTVVALHSYISESPDYEQENKWTFLVDGRRLGVPVSPFIEDIDSLVCKHRNIEGGMGVFFYDNAAQGGDWILQPKLYNAEWLTKMLPENPPLSTMRVVTCSSYPLFHATGSTPEEERTADSTPVSVDNVVAVSSKECAAIVNVDADTSCDTDAVVADVSIASVDSTAPVPDSINTAAATAATTATATAATDADTAAPAPSVSTSHIKAMSCVLRLGRKGASTDHQSVLFDVDIASSEHSLRGTTHISSQGGSGASIGTNTEAKSTTEAVLGEIKEGYTNAHWYQLGLWRFNMLCNILRYGTASPYLSWIFTGTVDDSMGQQTGLTEHMDVPGQKVSGKVVPNIKEALAIVTE